MAEKIVYDILSDNGGCDNMMCDIVICFVCYPRIHNMNARITYNVILL